MDAPDAEVLCLARLDVWGLICRRVLGHGREHFGDNGTGFAGYWGAGVIHVQRVDVFALTETGSD